MTDQKAEGGWAKSRHGRRGRGENALKGGLSPKWC